MAITKETYIGDLLEMDASFVPLLQSVGMHCLGCPASQKETIEQACFVHGISAEELVEKLNAHKEA